MITDHALLGVATIMYLALFFFHIVYFVWKKKALLTALQYVLYATVVVQTAGILMRWALSYRLGIGHAPLSNYYESLIFFSWSISVFMVGMRKRRLYPVITFAAAGISLTLMAYASLSPGVERGIQPLIPALQSNWLHIHVFTCFLGYAAFAISFICGALYFFRPGGLVPARGKPRRHQLQEHYYWLFHADIWYTYRSRMGPLCVGIVLELGPQGNLVAYNVDHLCPRPSFALYRRLEGQADSDIIYRGFRQCYHDLFRG